ncbi:MAG TPA: immunoglobulin-like domain-containing protein [Chryseosolibacter sp.]
MNRIKNILVMFAVLATVLACDRDFESDGVALGTIRFPAIQVQGDPVIIVNQGGTYTDAGAKALLGADDITSRIETSSDLDLNAAGVYTINYSVTNVNELDQETTVTEQRVVVVAPSNPNLSRDLSGTYTRTIATGVGTAVWTKIAPGLYINDNIGGVVPPNPLILSVYVFDFADGTLSVPEQPVNGFGTLTANVTTTAAGYNVVIPNHPNFGTGNRVFIKQ